MYFPKGASFLKVSIRSYLFLCIILLYGMLSLAL